MPRLSPRGPDVSPSLAAGLVLASFHLLDAHDLPHPTASAAIRAVGCSPSRAYEVKADLLRALPDLVRSPGRPAKLPAAPPAGHTETVTREVARYVMDHPGCVHGGQQRRRYSDGFRVFVLDLCAAHRELELPAFAEAALLPLGTLKDWLRGGREAVENPEPPNPTAAPGDKAKGPRIESILAARKTWKGDFSSFCNHVQLHLRIPWGRTTISNIRHAHGVRTPKRRRGRRPDEKATRDSFETFFPGAQWSADGSPLSVVVDGVTYTFNLELDLDTHTGALVGLSLRDHEDGAAVAEAFADGVVTTGSPPLAQLLDNRHSNHTDQVVEALGDTMKIRRTQGRPQNGAHVEGAFGLFQQMAPGIALDTRDQRELARQALLLVVLTWARTLNHRPQVDHGGRSRAQRYFDDAPTPEEVEAARLALHQRLRKQEKARLTQQARLDPGARQNLDEVFERLGLHDPEGNIRDAIAGYHPDAILDGIAIFGAKHERGTLPEGVDGARYLLGIVRRVADEDEGLAIAEKLWQLRRKAGDQILAKLDEQREEHLEEAIDPLDLVRRFADLAMDTDRALDRAFWLRAIADTVHDEPEQEHHAMFLVAARRIHAYHGVTSKDRNAATRRLAAMILPIV